MIYVGKEGGALSGFTAEIIFSRADCPGCVYAVLRNAAGEPLGYTVFDSWGMFEEYAERTGLVPVEG